MPSASTNRCKVFRQPGEQTAALAKIDSCWTPSCSPASHTNSAISWLWLWEPSRLLKASLSLTGGNSENSYDGRLMCQSSENASLLLLKRSLGLKENKKSLLGRVVCDAPFLYVRPQDEGRNLRKPRSYKHHALELLHSALPLSALVRLRCLLPSALQEADTRLQNTPASASAKSITRQMNFSDNVA